MKTILVPTDFSQAALSATKLAGNLARQFNSTIVLLHVVEGLDEGSFNVEGEVSMGASWEDKLFSMSMIEKSRKQLRQATNALLDAGVSARSVLRMGNTYHGIQSIITEQEVDLVVMGTEGSSGLEEILVGSNTEKVVRRSTCPVISVNAESNVESIKSIVWATSMNEEDLNLPSLLRKMMDTENVIVHLVRINTPGLFISDRVSRARLELFASKMKLRKFTVNIYNDFTEEEGIMKFASTVNADLIAIATHGRRGLAHLLNSSIAEDVVNESRTPVMTYVLGKHSDTKRGKVKVAKVLL